MTSIGITGSKVQGMTTNRFLELPPGQCQLK